MIFSDIHEDFDKLRTLLDNEVADLFICAGDWSQSEAPMKKGLKIMKNALEKEPEKPI